MAPPGWKCCLFLSPHTHLLSETPIVFGQEIGCGSQCHQQMGPEMVPRTSPPHLPGPTLQPPPLPSSPSQSFQVPGRKSHRTLCLSADSWKVTLNDECSWVELEGSFFLISFLSFLSPMNCITGQPLGFIHQTPVVFRPFPILLRCFLSRPLLAKAGY